MAGEHIGQNGLVLHILYFAWNFCIKLEPHQLTVILGLMSMTVFSGNLLPGKPGRDSNIKELTHKIKTAPKVVLIFLK